MNINITLVDGGIRVYPFTDYITKHLKYAHRSIETVKFKRQTVFKDRLLYDTDGQGGLYTLQGFFVKICKLIHKNKDTYNVTDLRTKLPPIDWPAVKEVGLRAYQIDAVVQMLIEGEKNSGIVRACGGFGKTYCQAFTYAAWNSLNTILAIPLAQVFRATYKKFVELFPDKHIGRVGDGFNDISKDITITTFKSLDKCAVEKCQLLLVDELQGCSGEHIQNVISSIKPIRIFGYTATDEGLFNGADRLLTGLFGERLIDITYEEGKVMEAVVPGIVYMLKTPNYLVNSMSIEGKIASGIKNCKPRNQLIAKVVTKIPEGWASLTFVDHIADHLIELYKLMPTGVKYVHRGTSKKELGVYALSVKQQQEVIDDFINNKFLHLIATDAFRAGVDIPHLRVVIQASGGSSQIEVIQEALRGSRTLSEAAMAKLGISEPKDCFVLIDFLDNHDDTLHNMSLKRIKYYKEQGWEINFVENVSEIDWKKHGKSDKKL
jgi:superfamily II DNA or RNA helicase